MPKKKRKKKNQSFAVCKKKEKNSALGENRTQVLQLPRHYCSISTHCATKDLDKNEGQILLFYVDMRKKVYIWVKYWASEWVSEFAVHFDNPFIIYASLIHGWTKVPIVLCLVLQSIPTHVNEGVRSGGVFCSYSHTSSSCQHCSCFTLNVIYYHTFDHEKYWWRWWRRPCCGSEQ